MIFKCVYIDAVDGAFLAPPEGYWARFVSPSELWRYATEPTYDLPESFVHRALATHDECFALGQGDEIAAYGWYSTTMNRFTDELTLRFSREWVYMYRGYTHPAHRGKRLHAIGMTMALAAYQARGFNGLVSCVEAGNEASLKSVYRMGYRTFGTIYGVRLGAVLRVPRGQSRLLDRQVIFCSPGCRRFGFRFERTSLTVPSTTGSPKPLGV